MPRLERHLTQVIAAPPPTRAARSQGEDAQAPAPGSDYATLKRKVRAAGLFTPQWGYYSFKAISTGLLLAVVVTVALWTSSLWVLALDAMLMGFVLTQLGFLGHDVAHRQVFRRKLPLTASSFALGNVLTGISYSWWHQKHNRHHANPNHLDEDPDINLAMFAHSADQIGNRRAIFHPIIAFQAFLYPVIGSLLFVSMRSSSIAHLFTDRARLRVLQAVGLTVHFAAWLVLLLLIGSWEAAVLFLLVSQVTFSIYNVAVFAPNHKGMENLTDDNMPDFLRTQVLTSRNVRGGLIADFMYGGLNYQIEHHLFPTLPRNQLGRLQPIVRDYCRELGVPYHETSVAQSYREIFSSLHSAGAPIRSGTI
jgi:fatty acid desaturase